MKKVIGIRCIDYDEQTKNTYETMKKIFPSYPIYFIVDRTKTQKKDFPSDLNVEYMTRDKLDELRLYHADPKIGWVAGDYSYYLLLKYDWDYMWLIEPDVYISPDLFELVKKLDQNNVDLIGAWYGERNQDWVWSKRLRQSTKFNRVFWIFFPFTRLSRDLVLNALKVRQEITQTVTEKNIKLPNDESVIGTVANWKKMSTLVLKDEYPEELKYFNLRVRYNFQDIKDKSGIFHPVDFQEKYDEKILEQLNQALGNAPVKKSLKRASDETKLRILNKL